MASIKRKALAIIAVPLAVYCVIGYQEA